MKNKSFRLIQFLILPLWFAFNASAEEPLAPEGKRPGMGGPGPEGGIFRIVEELDLTAEQRQEIRQLQYEERRARMELHHRNQILELDLQYELEKAEPDTAKIAGIVEELKQIYGERLNQRVQSVLSLRKVLTPEQYEKLRSLGFREMRRGMKRPKGIRGPGGSGSEPGEQGQGL